MTCSSQAVGIFREDTGAFSPRLIRLEARLGKGQQRLHPTIVECLETCTAALSRLTGQVQKLDPAAWGLTASIDLELLQGHSYGLAIFASMAASVLGVGTRDAIACTGSVNSDGTVGAVGEVALKATVDGDARYLVVPRENDPYGHLIAGGVRILHTEHVEDILWLLLDTPFLTYITQKSDAEVWPDIDGYLANCFESGLMPRGIGHVGRQSMTDTRFRLGQAINTHRAAWEEWILKLAPLSEPDPRDLLQGLFLDVDWYETQITDPPRADQMIADLGKSLVLRGRPDLARNLCNLVYMGRDGKAVLTEVGPIREFIFWAAREFERTGNGHGAQDFFGGSFGLGRRLQTIGVPDSELRAAIEAAPLETEVIHGRVGGKIQFLRLNYRLDGVQMDFAIDNPMALIDGSYSVPLFLRKPAWNVQMDASYRHPEGQVMLEHFGRQVFKINRFDTRLLWSGDTQCWPPSVDSLHFISDVYNAGLHQIDGDGGRILDLCCGCGVVGISLAKVGNVQDIDFIDFEPGACTITRINVEANFPVEPAHCQVSSDDIEQVTRYVTASGRRFAVRQGEASRILARIVDRVQNQSARYDRVFFTPPYVPEPDLLGVSLWRATAGTDLLEACISGGSKFCKELVVAYSRISESAVERGLRRCGEIYVDEIIGRHWVALRIPRMVDVFDTVTAEDGETQLPHTAKRYWDMYLNESLRETDELHVQGLLPHDGHGFRFAHEIVIRRLVFS